MHLLWTFLDRRDQEVMEALGEISYSTISERFILRSDRVTHVNHTGSVSGVT